MFKKKKKKHFKQNKRTTSLQDTKKQTNENIVSVARGL